jgi:hypothetical protein
MEYLGFYDLYGSNFDPSDINASGQVIGNQMFSYGGEEGGASGCLALLWENGEMHNLADLLPADSGLSEFCAAGAINDSGWIAGNTLSDGFVMIPTDQGIGPHIRVSDATVVEGNTGTTQATFTVTLSAASTERITVAYSTAEDTATAGSDYQAASGTVIFAPGETSKTVTVLVKGDRVGEANETFTVNLSNTTYASIADAQGVGTILDDEPRISISDVIKAEGKRGQTTLFVFTVTLSAAYDLPVTMSFRTANGSATTANKDYLKKSGTLTFAPGETTKTITIEVKGDSKRESSEYFYLDLFNNSSNSLFAKSRGIGTILNDD